jgi:cyclopropane fatty-acyl-phospholipid synthase-like methyltransferase
MSSEWWKEEENFFGTFYMEGDDSISGYRQDRIQTLSERTAIEVDGVVRIIGLKYKEKIWDIPCGYGRHSIDLARRGFDITGSDINKTHLQKALETAWSENLTVDFRLENMLTARHDKKFDAIINMFYSFGFFESDALNIQVLVNFFESLKPGGKFLMHTDVNIPMILKKKYKTNEVRTLQNGKKLHIIDRYEEKTKKIHGTWILRDEVGGEQRRDYSVRVYEFEEFEHMCRMVGFSYVEVYGDWDMSPYTEDSEDMIIVATK